MKRPPRKYIVLERGVKDSLKTLEEVTQQGVCDAVLLVCNGDGPLPSEFDGVEAAAEKRSLPVVIQRGEHSKAFLDMVEGDPEAFMDADTLTTVPQARKIMRTKLLGAVGLIAGGTVGAGIIALPVKTAAAGLMPSVAALVATWGFMLVTALLLVELATYYGPQTNIVTMASNTLGPVGKTLAVSLYLFIYSATLTAYISEGSSLTASLLGAAPATWGALPSLALNLSFAAGFGGFVYAGTGPTEKLNSACLVVAMLAFGAMVYAGASALNAEALLRADWLGTLRTLPIMVVAFTYHNMVPSLLPYLGSRSQVVKAVVYGSALPLVLYLVWQVLILGSLNAASPIPTTAAEITEGLRATAGPLATFAIRIFSLFAIITSFLGVSLGCTDFLSDLIFSARKNAPKVGESFKRGVSLVAALALPIVVAVAAPGVFLPALEFSGTFRLVLFGALPALMVWRARYGEQQQTPWLPGGKGMLTTVIGTAASITVIELSIRAGLLVL